jgi:hypothetical protein
LGRSGRGGVAAGAVVVAVLLAIALGSTYEVVAQASCPGIPAGTISVNTRWSCTSGPTVVSGNVTVAPGVTLTVDPGVTLQFTQGAGLRVNGTLIANGTAAQPITFTGTTAQRGWWAGISIVGLSTSPLTGSSLSYVTVEYGGGNGYANLYLEYATVPLQNVTIRQSSGRGIYGWRGATAHVATGTFTGNAGEAVVMTDGASNPILSGLSASGNGADVWAIGAGILTGGHTWENAGMRYRLDGSQNVDAGAALTIQPGVTVEAGQGAGLTVRGQLLADGTAAQPITFTGTTAQRGWWAGISIVGLSTSPLASSSLSHATVEYGGGNGYANLYLEYATVPLQNVTIRQSSGRGIYGWRGGVPNIATATLSDNAGYAIELTDGSTSPSLSGVTAVGNGIDAIAIGGGTVTGSRTWNNLGIPYHILGSQTVAAGATLTVEPGVLVRFGQGAGLTVRGRLVANGTPTAWITFDATTPTPGSWAGISFIGTSTSPLAGSSLQYAAVAFGGGNGYANVYLEYANVAMTHVALVNGSRDGLYLWRGGSLSTISQSQLIGNAELAIENSETASPIDARNNWFGSATGPTHASNPGGTGAAVSDGVTFSPWLTAVPDVVVLPASAVIGPAGGGVSGGALGITVPAGAVNADVTFEMFPRPIPTTTGRKVVSAFTLLANGGAVTTFGQSIELRVRYDPSQLTPAEEAALVGEIVRADGSRERLSCRVETENDRVVCQTDHFTEFEFASGTIATPTPRSSPIPVPTGCAGCQREFLPVAPRSASGW